MSEIEIDSIADELLGDSTGALVPADAQARVQALLDEVAAQAQVGFHGHQNLSLGVANSVLVQAGKEDMIIDIAI